MDDPRNSNRPERESNGNDLQSLSPPGGLSGDGRGLRRSESSLWDHKPWWCQPWSIVSTGVLIIGFSWWWLQRWWISVPLGLAIGCWWWLFLVVVPAAWRAQQAENHD
ncbi:MAG: DUF6737 family protein [Cyanobacteriota bacterium]